MAKQVTYSSEVPVPEPLASLASEFAASLADAGYVVPVVRSHLWLMTHLGRWMKSRGLEAGDLDDECVEEFFAERRAAGCRTRRSARSLVPLLDLLRIKGLVERAAPVGPVEELLASFGRYLANERAVAPSTVRCMGSGPGGSWCAAPLTAMSARWDRRT